jgi:hypothetical protein
MKAKDHKNKSIEKARKILAEIASQDQINFHEFSVESLTAIIERRTGRQVYFFPWEEMSMGMFGAWLSDADSPREYIFYRQNVSPIHQVHIQLHELAHILLGHSTLEVSAQAFKQLLHGENTVLLKEAQQRACQNKQDDEAEVLADLIQERAKLKHPQPGNMVKTTRDSNMADFLRHLELD